MGLYSGLKKYFQTVNILNQTLKEQDFFIKKVNKMIKPYNLNRQTKREINEKLQDLRQLLSIEVLEKEMKLGHTSLKERAELLQKYDAQNGPEAMASIAREINDQYNRRDTDEAKWVDLKVQFWEYSAKNYQELKQLQKLGSEANRLQADYLVEKAEYVYQELVTEERNLYEMVVNSKPENYKRSQLEACFAEDYNLTARIIKYKTSLYQEQGRTDLLWAYHQQIKDCRGDPEKAILLTAQYCGKEEKGTLEHLTQSAQVLREQTEVNKSERDQGMFTREL
ncbi:MAG: hypothetical protein PHH93_10225 [Prolixibacteraceae bacterium]|nr:hypothetical protein [Prolixibacteraceae bacterium]